MSENKTTMSVGRSLRHLVLFQMKLALDALRDFAFSPLSIVAFILDAVLQPDYESSLTCRMMKLGRRSDRVINLFDEHSERGHYTVDHTFGEFEQAMYKRRQETEAGEPRGGKPEGG